MAPTAKQLKYINDLAVTWRSPKRPSEARVARAEERARRLFAETRLKRALGVETVDVDALLGVEVPAHVPAGKEAEAVEVFVRDYLNAWMRARDIRTQALLDRRETLTTSEAAELIELLR
ncbi:MAG: hypothetical protein Q4D96_09320 [Propionibacteriaceae bacterium]|nr:hypothetical protein [Propionibacteriaceae bacterium]